MRTASVFDREASRYDAWFDSSEGRILWESELAAVRLLWGDGIHPTVEAGVGTLRLAQAPGG